MRPIVPDGSKETVYLVLDDFSHLGLSKRKTDVKDTLVRGDQRPNLEPLSREPSAVCYKVNRT